MSEPINQPTVPGDPASGVQGGGEALSSKQPANNLTAWEREEHAAAAVKDLEARIAELEAERDEADRVRRNAALAINIATAAMYEARTKREAAEARIRELKREVKRLVALGKEA